MRLRLWCAVVGVVVGWLGVAGAALGQGGGVEGGIVVGEVRGGVVDEYLERAVGYGFSGAALVARDGRVLVARGYGIAERGEGGARGEGGVPNTVATRFDAGSIAKQFTSAAVLRLEMLGKLSIDDPVAKFFDETVVLEIPEESRRVTLHQLMTHNSGLHGGPDLRDVDLEDRDEVVVRCLSARTPFAPGTSFGYANPNYFVLAAVIERVSGKPFEEAMRELVFAPAGMVETTFCGDEGAERVAHGHEDLPPRAPPGEYREPIGDVGPGNLRPFAWGHKGATGVLTTVGDLYRWHEALRSERVLSAEAKKKFFTPVRQQYACGWQVARDESGLMKIGHGGTTVGFEAGFARWEEDGGKDRGVVILLMNSRRGLGARLESALAKFALAGEGEAQPELPPRRVEVGREALERMVGVYRLASGGAVEMSIVEGRLVAAPAGQDAASLVNLPTAHLAPVLGRASTRAGQVLKWWMTGEERDGVVYERAVHSAAPEGAADRWTERWSSMSRGEEDPLEGIEVLGTFVGEEGMQTAVRLRYRSGVEGVRIFWRQDQVYGIGPYEVMEGVNFEEDDLHGRESGRAPGRSRGLAVELVPESERVFARMDGERWVVLRVEGVVGEGGRVEKVVLRTGEQVVEGVREGGE